MGVISVFQFPEEFFSFFYLSFAITVCVVCVHRHFTSIGCAHVKKGGKLFCCSCVHESHYCIDDFDFDFD